MYANDVTYYPGSCMPVQNETPSDPHASHRNLVTGVLEARRISVTLKG